jgi:quercetin dioxygenase-like cupin family protein
LPGFDSTVSELEKESALTFQRDPDGPSAPAILTPDVQQAVWFLGALIRIRAGGDATAGSLAILEYEGERGYSSPVHRHLADEETFFVLDGELRVDVAGRSRAAGAGAVAFLPRQCRTPLWYRQPSHQPRSSSPTPHRSSRWPSTRKPHRQR